MKIGGLSLSVNKVNILKDIHRRLEDASKVPTKGEQALDRSLILYVILRSSSFCIIERTLSFIVSRFSFLGDLLKSNMKIPRTRKSRMKL